MNDDQFQKNATKRSIVDKLKGNAIPVPPCPPIKHVLLAGLGGMLAIGTVALITANSQLALVLGSFGASCVLIFGYPDVPFSQPRNIICGHFLSTLTGLFFLSVFGPTWWSAALAAGTAIAVMMITRTVHPPAGSNPVIVFLGQPGWDFLVFPTLIGSLIITLVAIVYNNLTRQEGYPKYW